MHAGTESSEATPPRSGSQAQPQPAAPASDAAPVRSDAAHASAASAAVAPAPGAPMSAPAAPVSSSRSGATLPEPEVAAMFDAVAPAYDRINTLMTLGIDARWRRRAVAETRLRVGESAIDVACGTGRLSALLAERVGPFGRVEGIDIAPLMIERARVDHHALVQLRFHVASAMQLPFEDGTFDAATIAFGLRNLPDFSAGLRELARVVRPGGRVVCLELSVPQRRVWGRVYHATFRRTAPIAARIVGGSRTAYAYLPSSLDGFPRPLELSEAMRAAGMLDVRYVELATGAVSLHAASVPYPDRGVLTPRSVVSPDTTPISPEPPSGPGRPSSPARPKRSPAPTSATGVEPPEAR